MATEVTNLSRASRVSRKSILVDKGVNLCRKCKGFLEDANEKQNNENPNEENEEELFFSRLELLLF